MNFDWFIGAGKKDKRRRTNGLRGAISPEKYLGPRSKKIKDRNPGR